MSHFFDRFSNGGLVCAHRGARSIAPENTRLAMELAYRSGSDLWETDVQLSGDGELVLIHDDSVVRTTNFSHLAEFSGQSPKVTDLTGDELNKLDAGSWFLAEDPFGTVAAGIVPETRFRQIRAQRIPRLEEILGFCRDHRFPLNLEIKDQSGTAADGQIVGKVLDCLKKAEMEGLALISSFNHDYLRQVKGINPAVALAALVEDEHPAAILDYLRQLDVDAYHPDCLITPPEQVKELVASGVRVNLWTVNDPALAQEYRAAGATFICTDWPQKLVSASRY